jgi:formylglycine-generating enzyme required for sulfatase activity
MLRYLVLFLSLTVLTPAHASRLALVIGNEAYQKAPALKNPVNDATDMAQVLRKLGFEVILKSNLSNRAMAQAVQDFGTRLRRQGGVGLFYFSGHGLQVKDRNFLVPVDASINSDADIPWETLDANRVLDQMEHANNSLNIIILDACRDNPYARRFKSLSKGLARMDSPIGTLIVYATAPGKVASDGSGRNGTFTKHLLWALRTLPHLSLTDLLIKVTGKVVEETAKQQVPWQSISLTEQFCFSACDRGTLQQKPIQTTRVALQQATAPIHKIFRDHLQDGSLGPEMVWLPAGSFQMGGIEADEKPLHKVSVKGFAIGRFEVSFAEYDKFAQATGRRQPDDEGWGRDNRPVIYVSWLDAMAYADWLSQETGQKYRLPTEAEWEYAARAGTETRYWWGNTASHEAANYGTDKCCNGLATGKDRWKYTAPVGSFAPNAFGLYDTVGNVAEWTCSEYEERYRGKELRCLDKNRVSLFVLRGGSWGLYPMRVRAAERDGREASYSSWVIGFRLVRD